MRTSVLTAMACLAALPVVSLGQPVEIPHHEAPYVLDSGRHDGGTEFSLSFSSAIRQPDAAWLRVHFDAAELGRASYITIESVKDGGRQRLDNAALARWQMSSAFFNGDELSIELHVAPGDRGVFFRVGALTVGEFVGGDPQAVSLCDGDDRIASGHPAVGRIVPVGCTGWIIANGAHLTAGHCNLSNQALEFNVPESQCDGTIVFADPIDQYPVDPNSVTRRENGIGDDWAIFDCFVNDETGLLPVQAQDAFWRVTHDASPLVVRVTGFGSDDTPPGCTGNRNSDSQTQQTNAGEFLSETMQGPNDVYLEYVLDTTGGSSGSPVILEGTSMTLGIHTHAGCDPPDDGNHGTSFEHDLLKFAVAGFLGTDVVYVDEGHTTQSGEEGTVFRPFHTVGDGVAVVEEQGTLSIVAGAYGEALVFDRAITVRAPVGRVIIGAESASERAAAVH